MKNRRATFELNPSDGGSWKFSSGCVRCASFFGDIYAGGGECSIDPTDSFAMWKEREGAFRAMSCFSDAPELDELSETTDIAGGWGTGGTMRVIDELE